MTNTTMFHKLINDYNAISYTHKYIYGFEYKGNVYKAVTDSAVMPYVLTLDKGSRGSGYALRFCPKTAQKLFLMTSAQVLCSAEYLLNTLKSWFPKASIIGAKSLKSWLPKAMDRYGRKTTYRSPKLATSKLTESPTRSSTRKLHSAMRRAWPTSPSEVGYSCYAHSYSYIYWQLQTAAVVTRAASKMNKKKLTSLCNLTIDNLPLLCYNTDRKKEKR